MAKSANKKTEEDWQNVDGTGHVSNEHMTRIKDDYMIGSKQSDRIDMPWALPGEKALQNLSCVQKENNNEQSKAVLGRFLVTNYRIKFIENGKHKNLAEMYDSSSIPFGLIKSLSISPGGN